jgi:hypothetical protein
VNGKSVSDDAIRGQELQADGMTFVGNPPPSNATKPIIEAGLGWEDGAPILVSGKNWVGPGHNSVVFGDGAWRIFFHAFKVAEGRPACRELPNDNDDRHLLSAPVGFTDGWPRIGAKL